MSAGVSPPSEAAGASSACRHGARRPAPPYPVFRSGSAEFPVQQLAASCSGGTRHVSPGDRAATAVLTLHSGCGLFRQYTRGSGPFYQKFINRCRFVVCYDKKKKEPSLWHMYVLTIIGISDSSDVCHEDVWICERFREPGGPERH